MSISSQPVRKTGSANNTKFFEIMPGNWKEKEKEISKILFKYLVEIKKAHTFATPTKIGRCESVERSLKVWKQ
jgi:hypothetical protein